MSNNPFKPDKSHVNHPNRNSFDLSHSNHLTLSMGQLVPVLCKEVLPGDTFKIDAALGLRFMPLAFPIQTKCKAYLHFFYQRTKNLWDGFEDFINGNDKLMQSTATSTPPLLKFTELGKDYNLHNLRTCSLGDYLGLPTVRYKTDVITSTEGTGSLYFRDPGDGAVWTVLDNKGNALTQYPTLNNIESYDEGSTYVLEDDDSYYSRFGFLCYRVSPYSSFSDETYRITIDCPPGVDIDPSTVQGALFSNQGKPLGLFPCTVETVETRGSGVSPTTYKTRFTFTASFPSEGSANYYSVGLLGQFLHADYTGITADLTYVPSNSADAVQTPEGSPFVTDSYNYGISALPFRCYESIYNAFYRDNRNNPLYIDGNPVYNKYLPNTSGGSDGTRYDLYNRNWEYDQFTSAVPSPQQGVAPLVGISSLGDVTFAYEGKNYTFSTETADDNDTITKVNVSENIPTEVARSIVNTVTSGISINDFRNVNAYQRWLETNIRRGLKYKDQVLARWGVEPDGASLDMPEFIGGFSVDVDINTVTNTNGSGDVPLGDYAAQATAFGGSKHQVSQYCKQHGYIMAILSVVPVPVYTQTLDKMWLRKSALDYYSPEFGQIGLQPVLYKELCPLEVSSDSKSSIKPNTVFGYQRPWHDYIYCLDQAHGLFRTDFNQFLLSRTFSKAPTLGPDFLTVKESSLNDVFSVTNRNNILGMIRFNIEAQRPIPSVSIPSL
nr:major capsid protein [Rattus norvegicus microvirus]